MTEKEIQIVLSLAIAVVFIYAFASGKASKKHNSKIDIMYLNRAGKRIVKCYDPGGNNSGIHGEDFEDDSEGRYGSQLN